MFYWLRTNLSLLSSLRMVVLMITSTIIGSYSAAEKMDLEAHNLVIEKLETSLKKIDPKDKSINLMSLKIQLANLYSEKARLLFIEEGNKSCHNCLQSQSFKKKAITLYSEIQPQLKNADGGEVSLQLAYLLEENQIEKSIKIYQSLIEQKNLSDDVRSKALNKRASYYFKQGLFDKALSDYESILRLNTKESFGPIYHKIAWAKYNKGDVDDAIRDLKLILNNQDMMSLNSSSGKEFSDSFHREVARDLALFMAKADLNQSSLQQLIKLTPEDDIANNLLFLGEESERIGHSQNASFAWEWVLANQKLTDEKKAELLLSLAKHHLNHNHFEKAYQSFNESLSLLKISKNNETPASSNYKQFLVTWEKLGQKLTSSSELKNSQNLLIKSYESYLKVIDTDFEVYLWLAQLATKVSQNNAALIAYGKAADIIAKKLAETTANESSNRTTAKSDEQIRLQKILNGTLHTEISLTELTSNADLKLKAYEHYLKLNPQGSEAAYVQYQKAKLFYDTNQYQKSFELFNAIASDSRFSDQDLKLKSAHLALDSLVFLNETAKVETTALTYSQTFPKQTTDFRKISYNAGMKQVQTLAFKNASTSNNKTKTIDVREQIAASSQALAKLKNLPEPPKDSKEYKTHLRAKIDLAIQSQDWGTALESIKDYTRIKNLKASEVEWSLNKKLSISELLLDFKTAFATVHELQFEKSKDPNQLLKAALLAELTSMPVKPWLERVIRSPKSSSMQKTLARVQMVRLSERPWKTFHQVAAGIQNHPDIFANLALECFNSEPLMQEAQWALRFPGVRSTWEGKSIQRYLDLGKLKSKLKVVSQTELNTRSTALLASGLKFRVKNLMEIQALFKAAQKSQDWTLQVVAAQGLQAENSRLAFEIEKLPTPKGLKEKEKKQYLKELANEAKPFHQAAQELNAFLEKTWMHKDYISFLIKRIENSVRTRGILMNELRAIASSAPKSLTNDIQSQLNELKDLPSNSEISNLQLELRKDPFDLNLQKQLMTMEKKRGNQSMVVFLEARNQSLKEGHL